MPEITEIFYPKARSEWRAWLETNHRTKTEIWVRRFLKSTGVTCISYDEMVEECLCFGWIDGVAKKFDAESNVRRITPRRKRGSFLSELNRQRIWKLQRLGLMTDAGFEVIGEKVGSPDEPLEIPEWIRDELRADPVVWKNFQAFPHFYQRLKIGWISEAGGASRRAESEKRLSYLIKMTAQGKRYGTEPMTAFD